MTGWINFLCTSERAVNPLFFCILEKDFSTGRYVKVKEVTPGGSFHNSYFLLLNLIMERPDPQMLQQYAERHIFLGTYLWLTVK